MTNLIEVDVMTESVMKFVKIVIYFSLGIFFICIVILHPNSFQDFFKCINFTVFLAVLFSAFYEKILWRLNPFEKTPKLYRKYIGTIEFNYNGQFGKKNIIVLIKQSLLSVRIRLISDEVISSTITSNIVKENGNYVLYYTYITNPKSRVSDNNPIQYGCCRIVINEPSELIGVYWTSRKTIGDIILHKTTDENETIDYNVNNIQTKQLQLKKWIKNFNRKN